MSDEPLPLLKLGDEVKLSPAGIKYIRNPVLDDETTREGIKDLDELNEVFPLQPGQISIIAAEKQWRSGPYRVKNVDNDEVNPWRIRREHLVYAEHELIKGMAIGVGTVPFNFLGLLKLLRDVNKKYKFKEHDRSRSKPRYKLRSKTRSRSRSTSQGKIKTMMCC